MAAADLNTVRSTIETRLQDELVTGTPPVTVVFNNTPFKPPNKKTWVQCDISFGSSSYVSMDQNKVSGVVVFNVFSTKGMGPGENFIVGKRIRDLYNKVKVSGVYFDAPVGPEVFVNPEPESYFQTQVRITFDVFEAV
tara:strand:- start:771 stop:1184 length:414 start_codon:yes stop_codon:yes gene_type:complete